MDFESPEESKVFPGLYKAESGKSLEQAEYEEEEKKKKKKESKKDKGYAALAGESSPDEDELEQKSPASKVKKLKAPFKLSAKKKDKKSEEKEGKPKEKDKEKKSEKDKIKLAEKEKKSQEKDKKVEKELKKSLEKEKEKEKERKSIEKERKLSEKSNEKEKKPEKTPSTSEVKEKSEKKSIEKERRPFSSSIEVEREGGAEESKSTGGLNQAINAFLNAPAPILSKKFKEAKKLEKQLSIGSSTKAKLKLKRSKNSLEDTPNADPPFTPTHQFPEDAESLAKEIKKYEGLLEQTHSHIKSSKKVSKKNEEQLWELQRTLTQLKRKLRSVNVLSATVFPSIHSSKSAAATTAKNDIIEIQAQPKEEIEKVNEVNEEEEIKLDFTLKTSGKISASNSYDLKREGPMSIQSPCPPSSDAVFETISKEAISRSRSKSPTNSTPNELLETVRVKVDVHNVECLTTPVDELIEIANFEKAAKSIEFEKCPPPPLPVVPAVSRIEPQTLDETFIREDELDLSEHEETMIEGDESELCLSQSIHKRLDFDSCLATQENSEDESLVTDDEEYDDELFREFHDGDEFHERIPSGISEELADFDPFQIPVFETSDFLMVENKALKLFNENLTEEIKNEEVEISRLMEELLQLKADGVDIDGPEVAYDLSDYDMEELVSLWQISKLENESLNDNVNTLSSMVASNKLHEFLLETRLKYLEGKALEENPLIVNDNEVVPLLQSEL